MPTFNNPRQAIIVPRGSTGLGPLLLIAAGGVALTGLVMFVMAHLLLIAACVLVLPAGTFAAVRFMHRYTMVVHEPAPQPALPVAVQAAILAPPRRAIAPVHNHIHFHGLSADDIAAAVSRVVNVPPDAVRPSLHALDGYDRTQSRRAAR